MSLKRAAIFIFIFGGTFCPQKLWSNPQRGVSSIYEYTIQDSLAVSIKAVIQDSTRSYSNTILNVSTNNHTILYSFILDYSERAGLSIVFISPSFIHKSQVDSLLPNIGDTLSYQFSFIPIDKKILFSLNKQQLVFDSIDMQNNQRYFFSVFPNKTEDSVQKAIAVSFEEKSKTTSGYLAVIILAIVFVIDILIFIYFHVKRKRKKESLAVTPLTTLLSHSEEKAIQNVSCIRLFGSFRVYDKNGEELSKGFSPILKELLILLLVHSAKDGISAQALKDILWYDKSEQSGKNNRAVYFTRLRNALKHIDDINIECKSDKWSITLEDTTVDYYILLELLAKKDLSRDDIETAIAITKEGSLLPECGYEWLDRFKSNMADRYITVMSEVLSSAQIRKEPLLNIKIADSIFTFDPINELALKYKCISYNLLGKRYLSKQFYDTFVKEYKLLYGEEYEVSFPDIMVEPEG